MFFQTWNKYLPVIRILLKRSANSEQALDMNQSDFERAAGGKKVKFTFSITLANRRLVRHEGATTIAHDLISVLLQDNAAGEFLVKKEIELTMTSSFQLQIRQVPTTADNVPISSTANEKLPDET
jgi:hypothetical protein